MAAQACGNELLVKDVVRPFASAKGIALRNSMSVAQGLIGARAHGGSSSVGRPESGLVLHNAAHHAPQCLGLVR